MPSEKAIYFDGVAFAVVNADGTLGPVKKVAGSGPEYKQFIATNDNQFLLIGDQSPMVVRRLRLDGGLAWRCMFPSHWVLPSAAPAEDGGACIASPDYRRSIVHMIWIDAQGTVKHQGQIAGNRSHVVGANGFCTVLFDHASARESTFNLTSFDSKFTRVWTTPVLGNAPPGSVYGMAAVTDGYIVTSAIRDGLFGGSMRSRAMNCGGSQTPHGSTRITLFRQVTASICLEADPRTGTACMWFA